MAKPTKEQQAEDKKVEDWMTKKWRPMMAMMYMCVCVFDFILAPILWAVVQFWETQAANDAFRQWQPLTLQGAGLFHIAMGAVLGIAAFGRTQEKLAGTAANPSATSQTITNNNNNSGGFNQGGGFGVQSSFSSLLDFDSSLLFQRLRYYQTFNIYETLPH